MRIPPRHIRIALLMIISELLLVLFAGYWLRSQWRDEKNLLEKQLWTHYKESRGVVIDSLVMRRFVEPALGDSTIQRFITRVPDAVDSGTDVRVIGYGKMAEEGTPMRPHSHILQGQYDTVSIFIAADTFSVNDSGGRQSVSVRLKEGSDSSVSKRIEELEQLQKDLLLRSIKLVVQRVDDSVASSRTDIEMHWEGADSLVFVSEYESRLQTDGIPIVPEWFAFSGSREPGDTISHFVYIDSTGGMVEMKGVMMIGLHDSDLPVMVARGYRLYLLGKTAPQIIFALLLVIMTGWAFLVSYRGMHRQMILNSIRSNFVSNMSHELKTPVATVKVALESVRRYHLGRDPETTEEYLAIAAAETERLGYLIERVLDQSMIEEGSDILRTEATDLSELAAAACETVKARAEEAGATIRTLLPEGEVMVRCDRVYTRGVILNLLDNSLKYAGESPDIEVEMLVHKSYCELKVRDNGLGIPNEYIARVFDKFFRVPGSDRHDVKGYGLGLSYAASVMKMQGGAVKAHNLPRGIEFVLTFPLYRE